MDERLRDLERTARASPQDPQAGRALARALEQAGDRRRAWIEWCRLARGGDLEAWDALHPLPAGVRAAPRTIVSRELTTGPTRSRGLRRLRGDAFGQPLLLECPELTTALDPATLEPLWSNEDIGWQIVQCGPYLARLEDSRLVLLDGATGQEVTRSAPLGASSARGEVLAGVAEDRVVISLAFHPPRGDELFVVDAGSSPGTIVGRRTGGDLRVIGLGRALVLAPLPEVLRAAAIEDGRPLWDVPRTSATDAFTFDARGLISGDRGGALESLDPATGRRSWTADGPFLPGIRLAPDRLTQTRDEDAPARTATTLEVLARDRRTGLVSWRFSREVGEHVILGHELARDVVYVAWGNVRRGAPALGPCVIALDLETGAVLWELDRATGAPDAQASAHLVPLDGALALLASCPTEGRTTVELLG